jgi:hypothetical protein
MVRFFKRFDTALDEAYTTYKGVSGHLEPQSLPIRW